jgi:Tfp pilus assembly protein PilF
MRVFRTLSSRHPEEAVFRYHLVLALLQEGNQEQAKQECRLAVATDPALADDTVVKGLLGKKAP